MASPHDVAACRLRRFFLRNFLAEFVFTVEKWKELCCMLLTVGHLVFAILVDLLVLIIVTKTPCLPKLAFIFSLEKDTMHSATRLPHIDGLWVFEDSKPMSLKGSDSVYPLKTQLTSIFEGQSKTKQGLNSNPKQGVIWVPGG